MGMLNFDMPQRLRRKLSTPFAGADVVDCADLYADNAVFPDPSTSIGGDLDGVHDVASPGRNNARGLDTAVASQREEYLSDYMEEQNYLDLAVVYDWSENTVLRAGEQHSW